MMTFNFADKLRGLKGIQHPLEVANEVAPDVAPENAPVVAVKPVGSPAKRRLAKISARLSHAVVVGLIAVAVTPVLVTPVLVTPVLVTPVLTPRAGTVTLKPLQPTALPQSAAKSTAAKTSVAQYVVTQASPAQASPVQPLPNLPPAASTTLPLPKAAQPLALAAITVPAPEVPRPVAIVVTPDTPRRTQLKLPKGKMKTVRAREGAPVVTLKTVRAPGPMLASVEFVIATAAEVEPDVLAFAPPKLAVVKSKTVSERKAKLEIAKVALAKPEPPKQQQLAALEPKSEIPKIGVATRRDETTVLEAWADDQISEGRKVCQALLKDTGIVSTDVPPIREGACGAPAPVVVRRLASPKVDVQPPAMVTCPMAASLNTWLTKSVQPAAIETFGVPVVRLLSASSYACRNRYGQVNTQLSEHALVNALDLAGFVLADGRTVRVVESWGPVARDAKPEPVKVAESIGTRTKTQELQKFQSMRLGARAPSDPGVKPAEALKLHETKADDPKADDKAKRMAFLKRVHSEACETFGTVLGPEANDAHRNHFHFDMMARRRSAFCQ